MKKIIGILSISAIVLLAACGGNNGSGKKFAPQEKVSSMTDEQRQEAIAQKRAETGLQVENLLYNHDVKINVVEPRVQEEVSAELTKRIAVKMLEMASLNGISGTGTSPVFFMGADIFSAGRTVTGTAPQKMTVKYEFTFKVMNGLTGDTYATTTQEVMGVGNTFKEAEANAVHNIKNTAQIQKMLSTASTRIIDWYNTNLTTIKNEVEAAASSGDYALALAIVESIPQQATEAHAYATEQQPKLFEGLKHKVASDNLAAMQAKIAAKVDDYDPEIAALFQMIPTDSPEYAQAQTLFANYEKKCIARRNALEAKAERDSVAAREFRALTLKYE
ncbi:MAG: hypothetical protein UH853_06305, partial [Muribaculaceae bacterium]|nr:hypothetical protein [Muribaculaceae bacterium]